jgi:hypothetical protein
LGHPVGQLIKQKKKKHKKTKKTKKKDRTFFLQNTRLYIRPKAAFFLWGASSGTPCIF